MEPPEFRGIVPRAFDQIFDTIHADSSTKQFLVRAGYLEIYNEEIRDLLGPDPKAKLDLKEDVERGVYVKGLQFTVVKSASEILDLMRRGGENRTVGFTAMNADSSRSHSIFIVYVETSEPDPKGGKPRLRAGKLNLVDLAGSERQSKTHAEGQRLLEATKINLSLSALGNVISALVSGKRQHVPYRDSKLTRLLQDSLGGNTKVNFCSVYVAFCRWLSFFLRVYSSLEISWFDNGLVLFRSNFFLSALLAGICCGVISLSALLVVCFRPR